MNGIYGALQVVEDSISTEEHIMLIHKASFSCKSLLTIINDVLDYSKIESGKLSLELTTFSIKQVIDLIEVDTCEEVSKNNVDFQVHYKEPFHDGWIGDPVRIKQILLNLISNAIKFSPGGSVSVTVSGESFNKVEGLHVEVKDTGIGMDEDYKNRLFNRFEQADTSTTRKFGGTGLGLAISKVLIDLMGGDIQVESEKGKGSKFSVFIPLETTEQITTLHNEKQLEIPDCAGLTILLAEDNQVNQMIIKTMLKKVNAEIIVANDGDEAIELVEQFNPDFIFMDIRMPNKDGIETTKILKTERPFIPIIALTANVMESDKALYQQTGFDDCVAKPIEIQQLYNSISRLLSKQ